MTPAASAVTRAEIERVALFQSMDLDAVQRLVGDCPVRPLDAGEVLIAADQANHHLYLLLDGSLSIHLKSMANAPIVTLGSGESVGELSLIDRQPTSAFVVARSPSRVLVVSESIMWSLVRGSHAFAINLLCVLSQRLRYDNSLIYLDRQQLRRRVEELEKEHEALVQSERRYQALYDFNPSMFFTLDREGTVLSVNHFGAAQLGYQVEELVGRPIWPHYLPADQAAARTQLASCLVAPGTVRRWEARKARKDGSHVWVRQTARSIEEADDQLTVLIVCEDVTESRRLSEQLAYHASHDALTGLVNRRAFEERLERLLATARSEQVEHALCYLDLDQFKVINDTCGHAAGDELLRQLGRVLQGAVSKRDTLARLGGDEFGVLMEKCQVEQAERVAHAVCEAVENYRLLWEGREFSIGVSVGLVPIDSSSESIPSVLSAADAACYAAKDEGRSRIHVARGGDRAVAQRHGEMQWVARLKRALEKNLFHLEFQPIVPVQARANTGPHYELLLRLHDEVGEAISPEAFLSAAERYNLSVQLDSWVIASAFEWLRRHPAHLDRLHLCSINLSARSVADEQFLGFVFDQFSTTQIPPSRICFEVTQSAAFTHLASVTHFIQSLRGLGCSFALDNFGSGWSSLGHLKHLPVDFMKISGELVRGIVENHLDLAIVKSINELCQLTEKKTVAEWVENGAILAELRRPGLNIDYAQGFAIAHPQPLEELVAASTP